MTMTSEIDLRIQAESIKAAENAFHKALANQKQNEKYIAMPAAIAAFCEAEGLTVELSTPSNRPPYQQRLVGEWRSDV